MATVGLMGERYFVTFIDESSGRMAISLLTQKSEVFDRFVQYRTKVERETGEKIKSLRTDGGGEYTGNQFRKYLTDNGITQHITPPYMPEHNGISERANRTIMEMVRCMLFDTALGKEFWGHAALTAVHIINRLPRSAHNYKTPYEIWYGTQPAIGHLRVFGCTVYRHIPNANRRKLDRCAQKCRMIEYVEQSGTCVYRVYDEETRQVLVSRDVIFDEKQKAEDHGIGSNTNINNKTHVEDISKPELESSFTVESDHYSPVEAAPLGGDTAQPLPPIDPAEADPAPESYDYDMIIVRPPALPGAWCPDSRPIPEAPSTAQPRGTRRGHREMFRTHAERALIAVAEEPRTLQEALASEDSGSWKRAWVSELESLEKNGTWVTEQVPANRNIVGCRWLFKRKEDGRFKVRLVAKGYSQEPGVDFRETFAPVAKFTTLCLLLALIAENDWELHSMDVKTAFLNGELEEEIYMEFPEGVVEEQKSGHACRLIKAIYGLRQSPRAWYQKIHTFFVNPEFLRSTQDYRLYINYQRKLIVLVYVDDLILRAADMQDIIWLKSELLNTFEMTDLGELKVFLGLEIIRNRTSRELTIHQRRYIDCILSRHGMSDARPNLTPLDPNTRLVSSTTTVTEGKDNKQVTVEVYQSAVGSLMYAMLGTRPDIAYPVGLVSQFNHAPQWDHWVAVKRIFRYRAATRDLGIRYGTSNLSGGYSDADWGAGEDRKSVGGFVILLNGGAICWTSKKQTSIALSTTEAEYMAMTQAAKGILWLRVLLDELGAFNHITQMSKLNGDNQGALALARNPEYHAQTKHIDIQHHFVRELVTAEKIYLEYCPTSEMIADITTKGLQCTTHEKHTHAMGLKLVNEIGHGTLREGAC